MLPCPYCGRRIPAQVRRCRFCGEYLDEPAGTTVIIEREFPHLPHLILTFFTCGTWLPVYVLHALLASQGGGKLIAFLVGIPLCLMLLGCAGCTAVGVIGHANKPPVETSKPPL